MPIYEFYCDACNTVYSFLSRKINPSGQPDCPSCGRKRLARQISPFAATGRAKEPGEGGADDLPVDEARMERAMEALAGEAESIDENNPRQAARLMRKFSDMTGLEFKPEMKSMIERMEAGEDPEKLEAEMGGEMDQEDPFILPEKGEKGGRRPSRPAPRRDPKLYEM
jgi:putative FmdB family regulatory protein